MDAEACFRKGGNWFLPDKNKCLLIEADPVNIDWDKQKRMAEWTKRDAQAVARKLRPLVGKKVVLYGGGGFDEDLCRLENIEAEPLTLYAKSDIGKPYKSKTRFRVKARLKTLEDWRKRTGLFGELVKSADVVNGKYVPPKYRESKFEPSLGSWKLARVTTYRTIK